MITEHKSSVKSLEKAFDLLDLLETEGMPLGVRAIEIKTGIPKATAQRLLDVLETRGFVRKHEGKYSLWVGAVHLARSFLSRDGLARTALPVLKVLAQLSDETASLYVRQGYYRILIARVESPNPLRFQTSVGERLPLHIGASGHILCAGMPEEELKTFVNSLEPFKLADGTLLTRDLFMDRVKQAKEKGIDIGVGERFEDVTSIACAVDTKDRGVIAAINIAGPTFRFNGEKLERLKIEIRGAARELSAAYLQTI